MEKLSDYLKGKLSESASEELTRKLIHAKLDQSQKRKWQKNLKEQYQVSRTRPSKKNKQILVYHHWRSIAAVFFVITLAFLFYLSQLPSLEEQAMAYLVEQKHQTKSDIKRGNTTTNSPLKLQAYKAYKENQYEKAQQAFEKLILQNPTEISAHFYLGLSHLYSKNYTAAISQLKTVQSVQKNNDSFQQEADWFLALAYILKGSDKLAQNELEKIVNTKGWNFEKAVVFLEAIK